MGNDLYAILGLSRSASAEDVKAAYRRLSKEWHPDKHKGDPKAEQRFKEINEAYEVLRDPGKREMYDRFGKVTGGGSGAGGAGGFDFSGFGFGAEGAPDLAEMFESFFGGGGRARRAHAAGADVQAQVSITFAESVTGAQRKIARSALRPCADCRGTGAEAGTKLVSCTECGGTGQITRTARSFFGVMQQRAPCAPCHGSGRVPERPCRACRGEGRVRGDDTVTLEIPAGIEEGQTLRVSGHGDAGERGAPPGDLYVTVRVAPDPRFIRDGDDIRSTLVTPVITAILGGEATLETVHGPVQVKIAGGTQPGHVLRVRGKGFPVLGSRRTGDHFAEIRVEVPSSLSRAERRILEEWQRLRA